MKWEIANLGLRKFHISDVIKSLINQGLAGHRQAVSKYNR